MYAGVDPTGPSLHVGHMLPFMILAWGYVWGLPVTFLVSYSSLDCLSHGADLIRSSAVQLLAWVTQQGVRSLESKYIRRSEKQIC